MRNSGLITRRGAILAGLAAVGGIAVARRFPKRLPPTCGNVLRAGDSFTYGMQRALLGQSLVKEYSLADLTSFPATGTTDPGATGKPEFAELAESYRRLRGGGFADWRLSVEGSVARPQKFSLADLKQFPSRTQITRHTCEEGWTAIGQWTGVPLSSLLDAVGVLPAGRFVVFYSYDDWVDSIDMLDAFHPQTILAYGMNGRELPIEHGAPAAAAGREADRVQEHEVPRGASSCRTSSTTAARRATSRTAGPGTRGSDGGPPMPKAPVVFVTTHRIKFSELDPYSHMRTAAYAGYYVDHRMEGLRARIGWDLKTLATLPFMAWVKRMEIAFLQPAVGDQEITITSFVREFRGSDAHIECAMADAAGKDLSRCLMIVACVDKKKNRATDWPDDAMALFYEAEQGEPA